MKMMNIFLLLTLCVAATNASAAAPGNNDQNAALTEQDELGKEQSWLIGQMASSTAKAIYADHPELSEPLRQAMAQELEAMYANSTSIAELRNKTGEETTKIVANYKRRSNLAWLLMQKCIADPSQDDLEKNLADLKKMKNQYGFVKGPTGETLLAESVVQGNLAVAQWLVDEEKVNINEKGAHGNTAIMEAAITRREAHRNAQDGSTTNAMLSWFLERNADPSIANNEGKNVNDELEGIQSLDELRVVSIQKPNDQKSEPAKKQHVLAVTAKLTTISSSEAKTMTKQQKLRAKLEMRKQEKESQLAITRAALAKQQQEQQKALAKQQQKAANMLAHEVALAKKALNKEKNTQKHTKEFTKYLQRQGITSPANKNQSTE